MVKKKLEDSSTTDFLLDETSEHFLLHNVPVEGNLQDLIFEKRLLEKGKVHTQEEWITITDTLPSTRLYFAAIHAAYKVVAKFFSEDRFAEVKAGSQIDLASKLQNLIWRGNPSYLMTTTKVIYDKKPNMRLDNYTLIHGYGSSSETRIKTHGVRDSINQFEAEALFGTKDIQEVENTFSWATAIRSGLKQDIITLFAQDERSFPNLREGKVVLTDHRGSSSVLYNLLIGKAPARGVYIRK